MLLLFVFKKYLFIYLAALGLSCSTWDLVPWPEMELRPLHWESGVLATEPREKSLCCYCKLSFLFYFIFYQVAVSRYADYWYWFSTLLILLLFIVYLLILLLFIVYSKVFQCFQVCNMSTTDSDSFAFSF